MEIQGLGALTKDESTGWWISAPMTIPAFGGAECEIALEGYEEDSAPEDFDAAIQNFLTMTPDVLKAVQGDLYRYYQDCNANWSEGDEEYVAIATPDDVWKHVQFGFEAVVSRRRQDNVIYISLANNCDWEPEHGLQLVFKNGLRINKLGPYDGHMTNSAAYGNPELEEKIYR